MLLGFLILVLVLGYYDEDSKYKYTLAINPAGIDFIESLSIYGGRIVWAPEINFELKPGIGGSLSCGVNLAYWKGYSKVEISWRKWYPKVEILDNVVRVSDEKTYIYISEIEVGARRYFKGKEKFQGFYFYFGLGVFLVHTTTDTGGIKPKGFAPDVIFAVGYKYISRKGITIDPFLAIKWPYTLIPIPALGLYLGYSW
jgi:hypothetical protein